MAEKISFKTSNRILYDLDASILGEETRQAVQACVQSQKEAANENNPGFSTSADALEQTSEARLAQILEAGEDIHGIASDRSISNVITFGAKNIADAVDSVSIKEERRRVDELLGNLLKSIFSSKTPLVIHSSGHFWYPAGSFMGWHTNSRVPGWRVYINYAEEPGKSFFRYRDPQTKKIVTLNDKVWNLRIFRITTERPVWHAVYSNTNRFSFGYMVHQKATTNKISRLFKKLFG